MTESSVSPDKQIIDAKVVPAGGGSNRWALLALVLALAAAALAAFALIRTQRAMEAVRGEQASELAGLRERFDGLGGRLEAATAAGEQARSASERNDRRLNELAAALAALQEETSGALAAIRQAQGAGAGQSDATWVLREVHYLLTVAEQRLRLERDVATAMAALESVDRRLADRDDPSLLPVREKVIADLNALRAVTPVDTSGLTLTLADLLTRVEKLPLKAGDVEPAATAAPEAGAGMAAGEAQAGGWRRALERIWTDLVRLVDIKSMEVPDDVIFDPGKRYLLQQNLRLELAAARLEVLRGDTANFRATLGRVDELLERYYDTRSPEVTGMRATLAPMASVELSPELPSLQDALELVRGQLSAAARPAASVNVEAATAAPLKPVMRFVILSLVLLVAAVLLGGVLLKDTGFVVIGVHGQVIRTSFAFFVVLLLVGIVVVWWTLKTLVRLWRAPRDLQQWSRRRRETKAMQNLSDGFLALVEGDWREAERSLSDGARRSDAPLLHYLGAARAAQALQAADRQAFYLQMAGEQGEDARLPVRLSEMEQALHEHRLDDARALLAELKQIDSRHDQVLRMEAAFYRAAGEWNALLDLLPRLAKRDLLPAAQRATMEQEAMDGLMLDAERRGDARAIKAAWERVPRARRHLPEITARYARALAACGEQEEAHGLVLGALRKQWDAGLARVYGELQPQDALRQLKNAESWLQEHGEDPGLLLALGRLALRNGLWGKARSYLEDLIRKAPTPEAYRLLAEAQEQLGDRDAALRCHRQGLLLATGQSATALLPHRLD